MEVISRIQSKKGKNKSLHWNHQFALLDKVNPTTEEVSVPQCEFDMMEMLPSVQVQQDLMGRMGILVSRIVTKYLKAFSSLRDVVEYHIPHQYSKEMETKSNYVSKIHINSENH